MRIPLLLTAVLIASPVLAEQSFVDQRYENSDFGFFVQVPKGFTPIRFPAEDGYPLELTSDTGRAVMHISWGEVPINTSEQVKSLVEMAIVGGWVPSPPQRSPFGTILTGERDDRLFDQIYIEMCEGTTFASVRIEYDKSAAEDIRPGILDLARNVSSTQDQVCN